MDMEHERRLTEVEERSKSNQRRINKLEESSEALNTLATNMKVMVEKQEHVADSVDKLDRKVTALESKPGKRWENIVDKVLWAIIAAVVAFLLGRLGL